MVSCADDWLTVRVCTSLLDWWRAVAGPLAFAALLAVVDVVCCIDPDGVEMRVALVLLWAKAGPESEISNAMQTV